MKVSIRVKPGASRNKVGGSYNGALIVAVQARAVDGAATEAVLKLVAKALALRPYEVTLISGATSRNKIIELPDHAAVLIADLLNEK